MLDWPEQNQTSPESTLLIFIVLFPLRVMVCGPPAAGVFSVTFHLPSLSAVAEALAPQLAVTFTFSPASALPQTGASVLRWMTMLSVNMAAGVTSARLVIGVNGAATAVVAARIICLFFMMV